MSARPSPKPWPMKWIIVSIALFIVIYTVITLRYRKQGPSYQPYQDSKNRAVISRLRSAGYQRISATTERPAEPQKFSITLSGPAATITDWPGGLPDELKQTLIDQPQLPVSFSQVKASNETTRVQPYTVQFGCTLRDNKELLSESYVYVKDDEIAIVPSFERLSGELLARTAESAITLTIPAGVLPSGTFQVTLIGERQSKRWTLLVH